MPVLIILALISTASNLRVMVPSCAVNALMIAFLASKSSTYAVLMFAKSILAYSALRFAALNLPLTVKSRKSPKSLTILLAVNSFAIRYL